MTKAKTPKLAGVDEYAERPYEQARDENADAPREQVDQIADYHETHPTLKVDGPEHDPDVQAKVLSKVVTPDPQQPEDPK